jgi:hypothetical protein
VSEVKQSDSADDAVRAVLGAAAVNIVKIYITVAVSTALHAAGDATSFSIDSMRKSIRAAKTPRLLSAAGCTKLGL